LLAKNKIKYLHKSVTFNKEDTEDMKLHKRLTKLGHGEFNRVTKAMWKERMTDEDSK
jgi:hypothetical protein